MTLVYRRRKKLIKRTKAAMRKAEIFPADSFEKDFTKHLKEVLQPLWKKEQFVVSVPEQQPEQISNEVPT